MTGVMKVGDSVEIDLDQCKYRSMRNRTGRTRDGERRPVMAI